MEILIGEGGIVQKAAAVAITVSKREHGIACGRTFKAGHGNEPACQIVMVIGIGGLIPCVARAVESACDIVVAELAVLGDKAACGIVFRFSLVAVAVGHLGDAVGTAVGTGNLGIIGIGSEGAGGGGTTDLIDRYRGGTAVDVVQEGIDRAAWGGDGGEPIVHVGIAHLGAVGTGGEEGLFRK